MSGTDNMDEELQMDGNSEAAITTDAIAFQGIAYPQDNQHTCLHGSSSSSAIVLKANKYDKYYFMKHKRRGKALIFNLEKFDKIGDRTGSAKDVEELDNTFTNLGFEVRKYIDNVTEACLKSILQDVAADGDADCDCLVVVFMSHGEADDKLWARDKRFFTKELWEPFFADKCTALAGKPKLFFIQACRGKQLEPATFVKDAGTGTDKKQVYTLPNQSDILIAHSTIEGRQAARHTNFGSWFIQALCSELNENANRESILSMLTSVNRRVAIGHEYKKEQDAQVLKQQPVIISTLTRELLFGDNANN